MLGNIYPFTFNPSLFFLSLFFYDSDNSFIRTSKFEMNQHFQNVIDIFPSSDLFILCFVIKVIVIIVIKVIVIIVINIIVEVVRRDH